MKTKLLLLMLVVIFSQVYAQDDYRALIYNGPGNQIDKPNKVIMDLNGNIYVTGVSWGGSTTNDDWATIKYNSYGVQQWVARYNGTGSYTDIANDMVVDGSGNVYVTGWAYTYPNTECGTPDYITIKYNASGVQQWLKKYDGASSDDFSNKIAIDMLGNIYVTGSSKSSTNQDIAVVKYNSAGTQVWVGRYDGPSHNIDSATCIIVDNSGNVIVAGKSFQTGAGYDYIVIKYNAAGTQLWTKRYNGPGNSDDIPIGLGSDNGGNIFVAGSSKGSGSNYDFDLIKYSPSGTQLWEARYNGAANNADVVAGLVVDANGFAYITGSTYITATNYDYVTIQYAPDGVKMWEKTYNGAANGIDKPSAINITKRACGYVGDAPCWDFNVYVTGQSQGTGTLYDYATVLYDKDGNLIWNKRYNSTNNSDDIPTSIAVIDKSDYVFVTGGSNTNYATIWYFPSLGGGQDKTPQVKDQLSQNYPNPFNPSTRIRFYVSGQGTASITIYDILGKEVTSFIQNISKSGEYSVEWDAANLPSGVYIYKLEVNGIPTDTKKMLLVK
jgi:uncharacterized delta-60 repeat protein